MSRQPEVTVQLKLRFREDLRKRLEASANRNESSLNSEIVRRVESSFDQEEVQGGPATAALVQTIIADIAEIEGETGKSWTTDNETYAAVRRAVIAAILDRPPSRVENHDEVLRTLQAVSAEQEGLLAAHKMAEAILSPGARGYPFLAHLDESTLQSMRSDASGTLGQLEKQVAASKAAADEAYRPQLAAERRGRKLYSRLREQRKQSRLARKR